MAGTGTGTPISIATVFVVEDGTGLSTANSYLSVADADTYHNNVTQDLTWAASDNTVKENALIVATQYLDAQYAGRWRGTRRSGTQLLAWPRVSVEDDDGYWVDSSALPQKLEDACAELALRVVLGDSLLGTVTESAGIASESKTVGPISKTIQYVAGKTHGYQYPKVERLLTALIWQAGRVFRG